MIRPRHAVLLARTKLRSKRGMLIASIIVSSLLFAALIAAIIVFHGAQKSAVRFVEAANNEQYLVSVRPVIPNSVTNFFEGSLTLPVETIRDIKAFEKEFYAAERAKYKAAGVEYNEAGEVSPFRPSPFIDETVPAEQRVLIEWNSPVIDALLTKKFNDYAATAKNKFSDLQLIGSQYKAQQYYAQRPTMLMPIPSMRLIQEGKEDFTAEYDHEAQLMSADKFAIHNSSYSFADDGLLQRNLGKTPAELKGIPVIPSAQEVAKLFGEQLGIPAEPEGKAGHADWLRGAQEKAQGFTYQACYRNSTELQQIEKIKRDYAEIELHKDDKNYKKPSLLYALPTTACGDITIASDTRSDAEKKREEKAISDQKKLGTYSAPTHHLLTFQIVGLVYAEPFVFNPANAEDYIKGLLSGTVDTVRGSSAVIPYQLYQTLPEAMKFDDLVVPATGRNAGPASEDFIERIVAFRTIDEARQFISEVGCTEKHDGSKCDKLFYTAPYGSNYLLLDDLAKAFVALMTIAFPAVLGFALIIIWFTMSRMMAENRKETAVYRAMGARRGDITAIYMTYTLLVALRIAIVSAVVGVAAAFAIDYFYAPQITATAASMFGMVANAPTVSLFDLSSPLTLVVIAAIFVVSIVASIQPLIRNVLRPPVRDMRSE